ncbi:ADAMTS-like protein 4, partial [Apteryx mantelli]|uniref:ADAMTS-like protein 4 n=1 Tax=Apteryx mantelli TaxID=2696672 RepID=A0ABM4FXA3_9AVES
WGAWGACSQPCGPGLQRRSRACLPPTPPHGAAALPLFRPGAPTPPPHGARPHGVRPHGVRPGRYGYGKAPFALPLLTDEAPRRRRHPPHGARHLGGDPQPLQGAQVPQGDPQRPRGHGGEAQQTHGPRVPKGDPQRPHGRRGDPQQPHGSQVPRGDPHRPHGAHVPRGDLQHPQGSRIPGGDPQHPHGTHVPKGDPQHPHVPKSDLQHPHGTHVPKGDPQHPHGSHSPGGDPQHPHVPKSDLQHPHGAHIPKGDPQHPHGTRVPIGDIQHAHSTHVPKGDLQHPRSSQSPGGDPQHPHSTHVPKSDPQHPHSTHVPKGDPQHPHVPKSDPQHPHGAHVPRGDPQHPHSSQSPGGDSQHPHVPKSDPQQPHGTHVPKGDLQHPQGSRIPRGDPQDPHSTHVPKDDPQHPHSSHSPGGDPQDPHSTHVPKSDPQHPHGTHVPEGDLQHPHGSRIPGGDPQHAQATSVPRGDPQKSHSTPIPGGDPWLPPSTGRGRPRAPRQHQPHGAGAEPPWAGSPPGPGGWSLYAVGPGTVTCAGESQQLRACHLQACPPGQPALPELQCAALDQREFLGRRYRWEPFPEARGAQGCELHCRPVGYRFYVRHAEAARDGTPCGAGVCVGGRCLRPRCDSVLASAPAPGACRLLAGNFSETRAPLGYRKILEIPAGATRILVAQAAPSPNYLALRSRAGKPLLNGNWAAEPPGRYEAAGTVFEYRRSAGAAEALSAPGPTTEPLDVYMLFQQDTAGGSWQFFLGDGAAPPDAPAAPQHLGALTAVAPEVALMSPAAPGAAPPPVTGASGQEDQPQRHRHHRHHDGDSDSDGDGDGSHRHDPGAYWKRVGTTRCSATCGKGSWQPLFRCVSRRSHEEVAEERCAGAPRPPPAPEPCNTQPCPPYWDAGEWSPCSRSCGPGAQHRPLQCRQAFADRSTLVHPQRCAPLPRPAATRPCQLRACSRWEVHSNWSACSVLCGPGQRTRHVRCVSTQGAPLSDTECPGAQRPSTRQACDMGPCARSWFHSDWSDTCSSECGPGIQRRAVVCLASGAEGLPEESCAGTKPPDMRACNSGPCRPTPRWYTGPWSPCSAECGPGTRRRDVICVSKLGAEAAVAEGAACAALPRPPALQPCAGAACGPRWFATAWSACSHSCQGGLQAREVHCLSPNKTLSTLCPPQRRPASQRPCNTQPCAPEPGAGCRDEWPSCAAVVQARLCVYPYYESVCCAACARAPPRQATAAPPR